MQKIKPILVSFVRKYSQPAAKFHISGVDSSPIINQLPNGCTVASLENGSPSSRIAIVVNIGSRYESRENEGVAHLLRNCFNLSNGKHSSFVLTRALQQSGASANCTVTREHLILNVECLRDAVPDCLESVASIIQDPKYFPWELKTAVDLCKLDLENIRDTPAISVMDALHKAAYRDGLGRGLVMPAHRIGTHTSGDCLAFVKDKFVPANLAIAGTGVDHDFLVKSIRSAFGFTKKDVKTSASASAEPSVYFGGESRVDNNSSLVHFCIAAEGAALNDKKMLPLAVLQKSIGSDPCVKYSDNMMTYINKAVASVTDSPFALSAINVNYTDSGLLGLYGISHANDVRKITLSMMDVLQSIGTKLTADDVQKGKNQLKASLLFDLEDSANLVADLGIQALMTGKVIEIEDVLAAIDAVTLEDVLEVASKIPDGKFTMASVGKLHDTPFIDELK